MFANKTLGKTLQNIDRNKTLFKDIKGIELEISK